MFSSKVLPAILALVVLITGVSAGPAFLQSTQEGEFFPETKHWVRPPFLDFYRKAPDPLLLFGYPITEAFEHPFKPGYQIQFFQRARMEWNPNGTDGVYLAPLGEYQYSRSKRGEKETFAITNGACRNFPETNKPVCYSFLQYYDANQGSVYFGNPISDVERLNNRLVQYFQYARMEWRSDKEAGQRVILTDLGRLDYDIFIGDPKYKEPEDGFGVVNNKTTSIQMYVFVDRPLIATKDQQKIFVIVCDQSNQPVKDASITFTVEWPNQKESSSNGGSFGGVTNEDGFLAIDLPLKEGLEPNQLVMITARTTVQGSLKGEAKTMFRIWW